MDAMGTVIRALLTMLSTTLEGREDDEKDKEGEEDEDGDEDEDEE